MSLAERILANNDRKSEPVNVPEWGADLELRELSATDREALARKWAQAIEDPEAAEGATAFVVARGTYDPQTGERVFDDTQVEALGGKSFDVLDRLSGRILDLSGLGNTAIEDEAGN